MTSKKIVSNELVHYLPAMIGVTLNLFPIILWFIAYHHDHIEPLLPFISDLGVLPPETGFFALFMNLGSLQLIFFAIIRFEAMKSIIDNNKEINEIKLPTLRLRNRRSLVTGLCMAFGLAVASNFRDSEGPFIQTMHALGAYFLFLSSVFEVWFQSKTDFLLSNRKTGYFHFLQACLAMVLVISFLPCYTLAFDLYPAALADVNSRLKWNSSQNGYYLHMISAFNEWLLVFNLSVYYLSFVPQFRLYSLSKRLVVCKG